VGLVEECRDWYIQASGDLQERRRSRVALAALHGAEVVEGSPAEFGECPLREASLLAQAAMTATMVRGRSSHGD
jgi:hypothetical protein